MSPELGRQAVSPDHEQSIPRGPWMGRRAWRLGLRKWRHVLDLHSGRGSTTPSIRLNSQNRTAGEDGFLSARSQPGGTAFSLKECVVRHSGTSLEGQWSGPHACTAGAQVGPPVGEPRSHVPRAQCSQKKTWSKSLMFHGERFSLLGRLLRLSPVTAQTPLL